jgi:hypothetical protein
MLRYLILTVALVSFTTGFVITRQHQQAEAVDEIQQLALVR